MASKEGIAVAVAALYTSAGRNYAKTEFEVYHLALAEVTDDDLAAAVTSIIRNVDFGLRPPSPGLVIETVRNTHGRQAMLDKPAPCEPCDGTGWIEQDDRSMAACTTCGRYVTATPLQARRNMLPAERVSEPIAIAASAEKLRAARQGVKS